jgi:hypothetical protein
VTQSLNIPKEPTPGYPLAKLVEGDADPIEIILYDVAPKQQRNSSSPRFIVSLQIRHSTVLLL